MCTSPMVSCICHETNVPTATALPLSPCPMTRNSTAYAPHYNNKDPGLHCPCVYIPEMHCPCVYRPENRHMCTTTATYTTRRTKSYGEPAKSAISFTTCFCRYLLKPLRTALEIGRWELRNPWELAHSTAGSHLSLQIRLLRYPGVKYRYFEAQPPRAATGGSRILPWEQVALPQHASIYVYCRLLVTCSIQRHIGPTTINMISTT